MPVAALTKLRSTISLLKRLVQPRYSVAKSVEVFTKEFGLEAAPLDYLFLVPWINKGGGDLEVINYASAILGINPGARMAVIATQPSNSPWSKRLPKKVQFIAADKFLETVPEERRIEFLYALIKKTGAKNLILCNSQLGYQALVSWAHELHKLMRIYIIIFCFDYSPEGNPQHYVLEYLSVFVDHVDRVFADNAAIITELVENHGFSPAAFMPIYQPYHGPKLPSKRRVPARFGKNSPLKVLWAGRITRQKRPDILVEVARLAVKNKLPVEFHVYGSPRLVGGEEYLEAVKQQKGIVYHGEFDGGLASLDLPQFDAFLLTSQWEGLPNVLLEATAGRLPIIAADVGGVAEFVEPDKTGQLVLAYDDASLYVEELAKLLSDYEGYVRLSANAFKLLSRRHTDPQFIKQLKAARLVQ